MDCGWYICAKRRRYPAFVLVGIPPGISYRKLNPFGTVPFLQDDGVSMSESAAMMFRLRVDFYLG